MHKSSHPLLTHWGRVTHICVSKLTIIGSDNGLSPGRRQAIIWTNAGILLIRTLGTNFSEILREIHSFSFSNIHLKMSSAKWRLFGLGLNELNMGGKYPFDNGSAISFYTLHDIWYLWALSDQTGVANQDGLAWMFIIAGFTRVYFYVFAQQWILTTHVLLVVIASPCRDYN